MSHYGIARDSGSRMAGSDSRNTRTRYTGQNGVTVQTGRHDYWSLWTQRGHCFPSTRGRTSANQKSCARWPWRNAYDWGPEVVRFFQANMCPAPSPTPSPPTSPQPVVGSPFTSVGGRVEYFSDASCSVSMSTPRTTFGGPFCREQISLPNFFSFSNTGVVCSDDRQTIVVAVGNSYDSCVSVAATAMMTRSTQVQLLTGAIAGITENGACVPSGTPDIWTRATCLASLREENTEVRGGRVQIFDGPH